SVALGGATGNTLAGNGDINDTVSMPVGSSITYTATGTVAAGANGTLANTATIAPANGISSDANPADNTATDTDTIILPDLSITKSDGITSAAPGQSVTYTIVADNVGTLAVISAAVQDLFPANLTGVSYTSTASGGATGNTNAINSNINDTVNMPVGSSITYTVHGTIAAAATGTLSNTATITP